MKITRAEIMVECFAYLEAERKPAVAYVRVLWIFSQHLNKNQEARLKVKVHDLIFQVLFVALPKDQSRICGQINVYKSPTLLFKVCCANGAGLCGSRGSLSADENVKHLNPGKQYSGLYGMLFMPDLCKD